MDNTSKIACVPYIGETVWLNRDMRDRGIMSHIHTVVLTSECDCASEKMCIIGLRYALWARFTPKRITEEDDGPYPSLHWWPAHCCSVQERGCAELLSMTGLHWIRWILYPALWLCLANSQMADVEHRNVIGRICGTELYLNLLRLGKQWTLY